MATIQFSIRGSAEEPYRVTFEREGSVLRVYCTCAAGENGQTCKHRLNLLVGVLDGIESDNASDVSIVGLWLGESQLASALHALNQAELELEAAKRRVGAAKKKLSAAMRGQL